MVSKKKILIRIAITFFAILTIDYIRYQALDILAVGFGDNTTKDIEPHVQWALEAAISETRYWTIQSRLQRTTGSCDRNLIRACLNG
jgi:hypothetical protein